MKSYRLSEGVEYLFNYAPGEFAEFTRSKFFGSPVRAFVSGYTLFIVASVAVVLALKRREQNGS